ncbi:MAG: tetratricopeptide repeat protein [Syntrophorhabdaceae bacterium]|nr:tetratricopeptide repeat protein [Syntrophorhabdaceae bacterium]
MQKEKLIFYVLVSLVVGFIIGAVSGIKYATKDTGRGMAGGKTKEQVANMPHIPEEEIRLLEDALKADPNNLNALISLGNIYFDTNNPNKAIEMYSRALKIDPKNADVRTDMAIMYRNIKDIDRAIKEFRQAAQDNPKHLNSRYNLGVVLLHDKQDFKGAIAAWEDLLRIEPVGERAERIRQQINQLKELAK